VNSKFGLELSAVANKHTALCLREGYPCHVCQILVPKDVQLVYPCISFLITSLRYHGERIYFKFF
jgi:hypothetical protein